MKLRGTGFKAYNYNPVPSCMKLREQGCRECTFAVTPTTRKLNTTVAAFVAAARKERGRRKEQRRPGRHGLRV